MTHPNQDIVNKFFEAYGQRNMEVIRTLMDRNVQWIFPGHHPLGGVKMGVDEVVAFFDAMGAIMEGSNIRVENLVSGVSDDYLVECQRIVTKREDGNNLDTYWSILWTFRHGKIIEGRHLAGDQHAADSFFCKVY
jgi:ketosteroid isomerase-like protein